MKKFNFFKISLFRVGMVLFALFALMFYGNEILKYTQYLKNLDTKISILYNSEDYHNNLHEKEVIKNIFNNIGKMFGIFIFLIINLKYIKR